MSPATPNALCDFPVYSKSYLCYFLLFSSHFLNVPMVPPYSLVCLFTICDFKSICGIFCKSTWAKSIEQQSKCLTVSLLIPFKKYLP